jgi:hypothetical protein
MPTPPHAVATNLDNQELLMKHVQFVRRTVFALIAALVIPATAQAQQLVETPATAPVASSVVAPSVAPVGPVVTPVGITRADAVAATAPLNLQGDPSRRDTAWMIIGGAMLVVGSVVDGDAGTIIMVTGAVIGLTGLWRYLQ